MTLVDKLEALTDEATPGPWRFDADWHRLPSVMANGQVVATFPKSGLPDRHSHTSEQAANPELIAALRNALPEILAALRDRDRLAAENAALRDALGWYARQFCELGEAHECCGRLNEDDCSGCKARAIISGGSASLRVREPNQ